MMIKTFAATILAFQLVACSQGDTAGDDSAAELAAPGALPVAGATMPGNIQWFRNSAEYQAITHQSYRLAAMQIQSKISMRKSEKPWGVVLDCDETILNNSLYQKEGWQSGNTAFNQDRWTAWVNRKEATAVPGAVEFLKKVHALGGKVSLVTNRMSGTECPATEANLHQIGLEYDQILCKTDSSDKNPRFKAVEEGSAPSTMPATDVLLYVGDNIQDFPALDQTVRTDETKLADFGQRFIAIPNPMYGSWEKNPQD